MKPGDKIKMEPYVCTCGKTLESGVHVNGQPGQDLIPGCTVFICRHCYALHRIGRNNKPHPFTEADIREFKADPPAWFSIQMAIDVMRRAKATMN
jgi:hypothetical protein